MRILVPGDDAFGVAVWSFRELERYNGVVFGRRGVAGDDKLGERGTITFLDEDLN